MIYILFYVAQRWFLTNDPLPPSPMCCDIVMHNHTLPAPPNNS